MIERRSLSPMQRLRIFEAHKGICYLCRLPIKAGEKWDVEHPIPLALGGKDDDSNRAPAHEDCHDPKTTVDLGRIAKAKRQKAKHFGIKKRSSRPIDGSRASPWKRKVNGQTERRY